MVLPPGGRVSRCLSFKTRFFIETGFSFSRNLKSRIYKILEEKSSKFTEQNKENIKNILNPLQEKIQGFEKKVEDTQMRSVKMHTALESNLKG